MRWHLTAAVLLASCGLDTSPETAPKADESAAGTAAVAADDGEADSTAHSDRFAWRPRKRFDPLMGGDAAGSISGAKDAATSGGATPPSVATTASQANSHGQSGSSSPAANPAPAASGPSGAAPKDPTGMPGSSSMTPTTPTPGQAPVTDAGTAASGAPSDASTPADAGTSAPTAGEPDPNTSPDSGRSSGSPGPNGSPSAVTNLVSGIVDLVFAILDLSFGPVRPAEIEQLVSTILVLALAPADLVAESLTAVLTQLEQTRICADHPERCNPLCQNLESDCSVCGRDRACIDQVEHMCQVQLPDNCH